MTHGKVEHLQAQALPQTSELSRQINTSMSELQKVSAPASQANTQMAPSLLLHSKSHLKISLVGTSLVAQWLRICLPMQGTQVRALV